MSTREQIGQILGEYIPKGKYSEVFDRVQRQGRLDQRSLIAILLVILEKLDETDA